MQNFKDKILAYERKYSNLTYIVKKGAVPIILTVAHTMMQTKENGNYKYPETYTKSIAMFVAENTNCHFLIKNKDTGIDPNSSENDTFKNMLLDNIKDNNIKLIIDLHGAKKDRNFDVELGTLNNISSDYSTVKELIDAFNENDILNIEINNPFKGGAITQKVFSETDCDVIQIEINDNFRNIEEENKIKQVCNALIKFIKQYNEIISK